MYRVSTRVSRYFWRIDSCIDSARNFEYRTALAISTYSNWAAILHTTVGGWVGKSWQVFFSSFFPKSNLVSCPPPDILVLNHSFLLHPPPVNKWSPRVFPYSREMKGEIGGGKRKGRGGGGIKAKRSPAKSRNPHELFFFLLIFCETW